MFCPLSNKPSLRKLLKLIRDQVQYKSALNMDNFGSSTRPKPESLTLNFLISCLRNGSPKTRKLAAISLPFFFKEFNCLHKQFLENENLRKVFDLKIIYGLDKKRQLRNQKWLANVPETSIHKFSKRKETSRIESFHHPYVFSCNIENAQEFLKTGHIVPEKSYSFSMLRDLVLLDTRARLDQFPDPKKNIFWYNFKTYDIIQRNKGKSMSRQIRSRLRVRRSNLIKRESWSIDVPKCQLLPKLDKPVKIEHGTTGEGSSDKSHKGEFFIKKKRKRHIWDSLGKEILQKKVKNLKHKGEEQPLLNNQGTEKQPRRISINNHLESKEKGNLTLTTPKRSPVQTIRSKSRNFRISSHGGSPSANSVKRSNLGHTFSSTCKQTMERMKSAEMQSIRAKDLNHFREVKRTGHYLQKSYFSKSVEKSSKKQENENKSQKSEDSIEMIQKRTKR